MSEDVSNSRVLQAVLELAEQFDGMSQEQKKMRKDIREIKEEQKEVRKEIHGIKEEQKKIRQELTELKEHQLEMEERLSYEIETVGEKIELVSNRLLDTEVEVKRLKRLK